MGIEEIGVSTTRRLPSPAALRADFRPPSVRGDVFFKLHQSPPMPSRLTFQVRPAVVRGASWLTLPGLRLRSPIGPARGLPPAAAPTTLPCARTSARRPMTGVSSISVSPPTPSGSFLFDLQQPANADHKTGGRAGGR